jgi:hypothetical protein
MTYILLKNIRNCFVQTAIIAASFLVMSYVRPWFTYLLPVAAFPILITSHKQMWIKYMSVLLFSLALGYVAYIKMDTIYYVMTSHFIDATDPKSVALGKSSPVMAVIKIFLGPTPMHYLFHDKHFVQPFSNLHGILFAVLHMFYYITFAFFVVYAAKKIRYFRIRTLLQMPAQRLFLLVCFAFLFVVYIFAYGSADIRQRAIIITCFYLSVLPQRQSVITRTMPRSLFYIFVIIIAGMAVITYLSR